MSGSVARRTQADRRERTRWSLLVAAARGLSTYGYANLVLEQVAKDAGYTRGALYHLFANKEELALAVVEWVAETWDAEVRRPSLDEGDPLAVLLTMARRHAAYCRGHDRARVMLTLRVELTGQDHPVGRAMETTYDRLEAECADLVRAGRRDGSIPAGPPPRLTARAFLAILESVGIELARSAPHDVELVERAVQGVLGVPSPPVD
ncbi:TetR/AcrR family transcriptional regulator [Mumia sp. zg.B53]|uniref:TetR/AcrR family transcriptional regulator n=1 Tax=unclassified Mumia TaxID=2621872 RepID=UPI001C6EA105|nr:MULTISPECIES: TetR/AcrR family transcriptional regulator [unclassified Mumia]MBW9207455.1 TetR/AcrR family transcriptional regulator [Mumia sp. zg.B17]MBW9210204.1 TetR/AcrR family transcriptional regulator [Mumia sp. zg.B21]MBW9214814.1 TetR/AcrR family transcriptional regulator [Mumia sp. zg.B53]MDD9350356.1 TetR/AcrR family transcriptional regulator [Mumia sp.]